MNIKQLREKLSEFPDDMEVLGYPNNIRPYIWKGAHPKAINLGTDDDEKWSIEAVFLDIS